MNALKEAYDGDFDIVGVPSNVFGLQEPGANQELMNGYEHVRPGGGYKPNFQIASKVDVNGANEVSLYTFMKSVCPRTSDSVGTPSSMYWAPVRIGDLNWNFEKFLIDSEGKPYKRYNPAVPPQQIIPDIEDLIAQTKAAKVAENDVVANQPKKPVKLAEVLRGGQ